MKRLYVFKNELRGIVKIGIANDVDRRKREIENTCGFRITTCFVSPFYSKAHKIENKVHRNLKKHRQVGEWFSCSEAQAIENIKNEMNKPRYVKDRTSIKENKFISIKEMYELI